MKYYIHAKFGATFIECHFFNWILKKKNNLYYYAHTISNYMKIVTGVNFCGDLPQYM